jgi:hypothetical protein
VFGIYGDDRLIGESAVDRLYAHDGDDRIWARDGILDDIFCGPGNDRVYSADMIDVVNSDCEIVTRFERERGFSRQCNNEGKHRLALHRAGIVKPRPFFMPLFT